MNNVHWIEILGETLAVFGGLIVFVEGISLLVLLLQLWSLMHRRRRLDQQVSEMVQLKADIQTNKITPEKAMEIMRKWQQRPGWID